MQGAYSQRTTSPSIAFGFRSGHNRSAMLMESVKQLIHDLSMIPSGESVLVAVSGGLDSIVLLDVLVHLSDELSFDIIVGHIDHGLRGAASTQDAAFVHSVADGYGLPIAQHILTHSDMKRGQSHGREGAARHARLAALETLAAKAGASRIASGHTLDDHAETILYHLARGAGHSGLRGIPPVRIPFIRPLIRTSRSDVHAYAIERVLTWREDATNSDLTYTRNRIRHHVLPELRTLNPRIIEALSRNADLLTDLDEAVAFLVTERMLQLQIEPGNSAAGLCRSKLASLPDPVLRLILREGVRRVRGNLDGIEFTHIEALRSLITGRQAHGDLSLPGLHVRMQGDALVFSCTPPAPASSWEVTVDLGETQFPNGKSSLELKIVPMADVELQSIRSDRWIEVADADRVTFPLCLRTRQQGDRFTPLGLGQEIKLKDFLMNEHTPHFDRDSIPLLCDSRSIIWVVGIRLSDTVKLSSQTQRVLVMRMKGVG